MKKIFGSIIVAILLMIVLATVAFAGTGVTDPKVLRELAAVRQATDKYHDVNVALADGFIRTPQCVQEEGSGGMGIHFINPARIINPAINILEPEILLYVETAGGMKLIGVEYMFPIGRPDAPIPNPAPPAPVFVHHPPFRLLQPGRTIQ
jgi:hypothetical protein